MARKKYDFRPDKPKADLLGKLYLTPTQRRNLLRWVLYGALLLVLSLLQDVVLCRMDIFGATTDLVPCAILLICVQLGAHGAAIFALVAACMYQFSGTAPGYYVIGLIPVLGLAAALLRQGYFRKSFSSTMLCACTAVLLYELGVFGFGLLFESTIPTKAYRFLLAAALSLLSYPVLYPVTGAIERIGEKAWKE